MSKLWSLVFHIRTGVTDGGHCNDKVIGIPGKDRCCQ